MEMAAVAKGLPLIRPSTCFASPLLLPSHSSASRASPPFFSASPASVVRQLRLRCRPGRESDAVERAPDCALNEVDDEGSNGDTVMYSISPLPLLFAAALPGASTIRSVFGPLVELVKSWDLPGWLVHWGHPANMAVVLFAMGGYGTYLGFRIRFSGDVEEKAKAKDLHPKLLATMFVFFAVGATGGVTSLLTSDKPILESPHAITGAIGLALLTIQAVLPSLFEGNPGLRNVHGLLGSSIMALFLVHAAFGLQLGLSS